MLLGTAPALARTVTARLPDDMNAAQAREWVLKMLARNLHCIDSADEIVTRGGVFALIGPTGVGKTTTTAKLAARCAVRYGANRLALITTDSFRIGAQDQLRIYAKILGVAVHTVSDRHDLRQALDAVRGRHLVLIDTVGMSQRDARVAEQAMLLAQPEIRRILLLNAAAQGETLDEVVESYGRVPDAIDQSATSELAGCIVTKQDEAGKLGTALDVAIRRKLPLHYVTSGQRVPEDLFVPTAELMIERSLRSAGKPSAFSLSDDDLTLSIAGPAGACACVTTRRAACAACSPGARGVPLGVGGVDATPVVGDLARTLAELGSRVLVIDRTRGELAARLNARVRFELAHVVAGDKSLAAVLDRRTRRGHDPAGSAGAGRARAECLRAGRRLAGAAFRLARAGAARLRCLADQRIAAGRRRC